MTTYTLSLNEIDKTKLAMAGGKGANLGELSRIGGVQVPDGFCVTTEAYREIVEGNEAIDSLLDVLTTLKAGNRKTISETSAKIRKLIEETPVPKNIENEIVRRLKELRENTAYAVRSSATAEDLPRHLLQASKILT